MQQGWPQQQQQQQQQQAGTSGQGQAPMQGQAPVQYPYPPFMPMLVPYGMPPPMQGMPGPFRVHVAGHHHQGVPAAGPNAGQATHKLYLNLWWYLVQVCLQLCIV